MILEPIKTFSPWFYNELPEKPGRIFDKQKTDSNTPPASSQTVDSRADTLRSAEIQTVSSVRDTVAETLEEKVARLERMNAALTEENKQLKKMAITDRLTGLHTRGYFEDQMTQAVDQTKRYGTNFSLVLIDLDKFKNVNDELGHQAGDAALKIAGRLIHETFRPSDVKCRYGGEELVVILPETDTNEALIAAERLRQAMEEKMKPELKSLYPDKAETIEKQSCTVSAGVAGFLDSEKRADESTEEIMAEMISEADYALYRAKNNGRNQVLAYVRGKGEVKVDTALQTVIDVNKEAKDFAQEIKEKLRKSISVPSRRKHVRRDIGRLLLFPTKRRPRKKRR